MSRSAAPLVRVRLTKLPGHRPPGLWRRLSNWFWQLGRRTLSG